jgi:hypothetical protein
MFDNIRSLLVDSCDVQRAQVAVDKAPIQDRRVSQYNTVLSGVACWFEPGTTDYQYNKQLGQVPIRRATVHFTGGLDIREGDRLKKLDDGSIWLISDVMDYSSQGFAMFCQVRQHNPAMGT